MSAKFREARWRADGGDDDMRSRRDVGQKLRRAQSAEGVASSGCISARRCLDQAT